MLEGLLILNSLLLLVALAALVMLLRRPADRSAADALTRLQADVQRDLVNLRSELAQHASNQRHELSQQFNTLGTSVNQTITAANQNTGTHLGNLSNRFQQTTQTSAEGFTNLRSELELKLSGHATRLSEINTTLTSHLNTLRTDVDRRLNAIQTSNEQKLEQMRATVDEKLQGTLDKRLGESFKQVSDRLEQVYTGLGEVRALSSGVNDLRRVMSNVKTRGTWGEWQLATLLQEMLTPDQYSANVPCNPESQARVEFAVKLPGHENQNGASVWLPIDSKFPIEDYQRLTEAADRADAEAVAEASKALLVRVHDCARDIRDKYINPPHTTNFAILFLPTESLYAEVLRKPGVMDELQRSYRVVIAGPTTLAAQLSSLQMGFRTLAIQQRSSEVWEVLGAVKTEFADFAGVLAKVEKKLQEASNTVQQAAVRTRAITRKMREVEALPADQAAGLLDLPSDPTPEGLDQA